MKHGAENNATSRRPTTFVNKFTDKNLEKEKSAEPISNLGGPSKITATGALNNGPGNVNVICRFRPLNEKEKNISAEICCEFLDPQRLNIRSQGENNLYKFSFDRTYDPNSSQQDVFEYAAKPIVESVLEGFNGTILAYGQTSSGKTHTMQGVIDNLELEGIIPRMIRHIFNYIMNSSVDLEYTVKTSMLEIYQEKIRDLVDIQRTNLNVREDPVKGLYIEDLSEHYVASEDEVLEIMKIGSDNRSIGATNMNEHSSRSHSIFIMTIHQNNLKDLSAKTGKLYLVDLAGSEKISKTGATGLTLEEAKTINKSLTTLGMVINSLTDGKSSHVPYRESKLTRVLQESLGGNSKTCLIITCSPSVYNEAETLSTLRFGLRAKKIKNKPKINKEVTVAELKIEIDKLEQLLAKSNKRISQLENYIRNNDLLIPSEEEIILEQQINRNLLEQETEEKINNQNKFSDLNHKVTTLDEDKKNLKEKLESVTEFLKHVPFDRELLISQLENIIVNYETTEKELKGKIEVLESSLKEEFEKNIRTNVKGIIESEKAKDDEIDDESNYSRRTISENRDKNILNGISDSFCFNETNSKKAFESEKIIKEFFNQLEQATSPSLVKRLVEEYKHRLENIKEEEEIKPLDEEEKNISWENLLEQERSRYDNEKKIIMKALEDKSDKLCQFEVENKDLQEKIKNMELKFNPEEKCTVKKILILEKNLEQLNKMFQHAMAQKSIIILDKESLENKIKKRKMKINVLEKELNELRDQIKVRDEKLSFLQMQRGTLNRNLTTGNNVVRIIRGGHLKQNAQIMDMLNLGESTKFFSYNRTES